MRNRLSKLFHLLASTAFSLVCVGLAIVLVVVGTIAQVNIGAFEAQKVFFNSFCIYWPLGSLKIPLFPGGLSVGLLWVVNLVCSFIHRYQAFNRGIGMWLSHVGILLLLLGQCLTQLLSQETMMPIEEGQTKDYTESRAQHELAVLTTAGGRDQVVSVPLPLLAKQAEISVPQLPFKIVVRRFYGNAWLSDEAKGQHLATQGVGLRLGADELPLTSKDDEVNVPAAYLEIVAGSQSLGTWLVSSDITEEQKFSAGDRDYRVSLRPKRFYLPYSLTLKKFTRETYPGTDIPKKFSSLVQINNPAKNESRDALIYMNNPLRYEGLAFYQSSYGKNDTLSIFQVVRNPVWLAPYFACVLVTVGLLLEFMSTLFRRKSEKICSNRALKII